MRHGKTIHNTAVTRCATDHVKAENKHAISEQLTLNDLVVHLQDLTNWEHFAIHLGISTRLIDDVTNQFDDVQSQKKALFQKWLLRSPCASWKDVIKALETTHHSNIAKRLQEKFLIRKRVSNEQIFAINRNGLSSRKISVVNILLYFLLFLCVSDAQSPVFSVHPVSTAAVDGSTVNFTCTANNTDTIVYRVNGTSAALPTIREQGFDQQDITIVDGGITRVLLVAVSSIYNNSEIFCEADGSPDVDSNIANLTVQGPLSSVNLSHYFIDSSTVNISWSPPFTLPGTNITGYNISATSNGTTTNYFTTDSYYVLLLTDITDSPCNEIIITVSGYNGLDGENESLTEIYLPSATIDSPVPMYVFINRDLTLSVRFDVSDLCVGQYPDNAQFYLVINGSRINSTNITTLDNFTVNNILRVVEDTVYTLVASLSNLNGTFNNMSILTFNTFSIESVAITDTNGRVCVECVFASFSTDSVCTVELVSNNTGQEYNETFSRSSTNSTAVASGCIPDVISDVYTVRVLNERGKAVDLSLLPSNVTVTDMVTTTTSSAILVSEPLISTPTPSFSNIGNRTEPPSNNDDTLIIAVSVTVPVAAVGTTTVTVTVIIVVYNRKRTKKNKQVHNDNSPKQNIGLEDHRSSTDSQKQFFPQKETETVMKQYSNSSNSTENSDTAFKEPNQAANYESIIEVVRSTDPTYINDEPSYAVVDKDNKNKKPNPVLKMSRQTYAELTMNVDNKPRARVPQQPVDYAAVDHQKTANQQIITDTAFTSENVDPSPEAKHHTSFSPPPVPAKKSGTFL